MAQGLTRPLFSPVLDGMRTVLLVFGQQHQGLSNWRKVKMPI